MVAQHNDLGVAWMSITQIMTYMLTTYTFQQRTYIHTSMPTLNDFLTDIWLRIEFTKLKLNADKIYVIFTGIKQ